MKRLGKSAAIKRLKIVLDRVPELKSLTLDAPEFDKWHRDARVAIRDAFGRRSEQLKEFTELSFFLPFLTDRSADADQQNYHARALAEAEVTIQSMIDEILEADQDTDTQGHQMVPQTREVFIVHGRDAGAKDEIARFVEKLRLKPIILAEVPSKGMTIIEKFEAHADVGYAIVLLTADDSGALKGEEVQPRARQNVIFELGFFIGKLGRKRVCALTRGGAEIPSDYAGVVYIPLDSNDSWKMPLIREIKAAGLDVDANRAFD